MAIKFGPSATRHRISRERIAHVIRNCPMPLWPPEDGSDPDLVLFLGPDANGVPLEIVAIELANDDLYVIHAMRLRARYVVDYLRVMHSR